VNRQEDFIEVPLITWLGTSTLQLIGVVLPKLQTPLADGFMGHVNTAFAQQFLHIEPDTMADDLAGKAVIFVAFGGSGWRHVWLPIGVCAWFVRVQHRSKYLTGQAAGSTT
jgi:hypothetical protein